MAERMRMYWYNFDTDEYDYRTAPETDEEIVQYIPRVPAARSLFALYREQGMSTSDAMVDVLKRCVGEES